MAEDRFYGIVIGIGNIVQTHTTGRGHDDTRALLLLRRLLQFHESLGSRKHANEGWCQPSKVACRALNAIDQLQESSHLTKGDGLSTQSDGTPQESYQIAYRKTAVDKEV